MKLTPKGQRIGDKIRKQLSDPDSSMNECVRTFKAWTRLFKSNPKKYKLQLNMFGDIEFIESLGKYGETVHPSHPWDIGCFINLSEA